MSFAIGAMYCRGGGGGGGPAAARPGGSGGKVAGACGTAAASGAGHDEGFGTAAARGGGGGGISSACAVVLEVEARDGLLASLNRRTERDRYHAPRLCEKNHSTMMRRPTRRGVRKIGEQFDHLMVWLFAKAACASCGDAKCACAKLSS